MKWKNTRRPKIIRNRGTNNLKNVIKIFKRYNRNLKNWFREQINEIRTEKPLKPNIGRPPKFVGAQDEEDEEDEEKLLIIDVAGEADMDMEGMGLATDSIMDYMYGPPDGGSNIPSIYMDLEDRMSHQPR